MPDEPVSPLFFPQPAYALIIGISDYQHSQPADDKSLLEDKNFRALKFAAKDAEDFEVFLKENGFVPDNIVLLRNEEATLKNITIEFGNLIRACKAPNTDGPLVIVYFSGHGCAEDDNSHYLVPYDGERDHLFGTAIPNEAFNSLLDKLATNQLVVFLDCCHAGGMAGAESKGARGEAAPAVSYDFKSGLGEGAGRFVIASCGRGQESYESGGNGIFTRKLLDLLGGQSPLFANEEKIEVFPLYQGLKKEVSKAAHEIHGKQQLPQINQAKEATGIVLAINQKARRAREEREREDRQKRDAFFKAVTAQLRRMSKSTPGSARTIAYILHSYVSEGQREEENEGIYSVFDHHLQKWAPGVDNVVLCCKVLFFEYNQGSDEMPLDSGVETAAKPLDRLETAPRTSLVSPPPPKELSVPPLPPAPQPPRRTPESELRTIKLDGADE